MGFSFTATPVLVIVTLERVYRGPDFEFGRELDCLRLQVEVLVAIFHFEDHRAYDDSLVTQHQIFVETVQHPMASIFLIRQEQLSHL
jgi:hypothetical protein